MITRWLRQGRRSPGLVRLGIAAFVAVFVIDLVVAWALLILIAVGLSVLADIS